MLASLVSIRKRRELTIAESWAVGRFEGFVGARGALEGSYGASIVGVGEQGADFVGQTGPVRTTAEGDIGVRMARDVFLCNCTIGIVAG